MSSIFTIPALFFWCCCQFLSMSIPFPRMRCFFVGNTRVVGESRVSCTVCSGVDVSIV